MSGYCALLAYLLCHSFHDSCNIFQLFGVFFTYFIHNKKLMPLILKRSFKSLFEFNEYLKQYNFLKSTYVMFPRGLNADINSNMKSQTVRDFF